MDKEIEIKPDSWLHPPFSDPKYATASQAYTMFLDYVESSYTPETLSKLCSSFGKETIDDFLTPQMVYNLAFAELSNVCEELK